MTVETSQLDGGIALITLKGRLVLGREVEQLETAVADLVKQPVGKVIFDASALDYADSAGIGTLIACLTSIRKAGGDMRLAAVNPRIQRLFQLTGINHLMATYAS